MIFPSPVRFTVLPVFPMWPWSAFWKTVFRGKCRTAAGHCLENPYRRKFSILVRILADGRTTDIPLGRFLREFTCDRPDLFKRSPVNRHAVLKEMAGDPELQKWREKYLDIYPQDPVPVSQAAPVAREWRKFPARSLTRNHRITVTAIICN